MSNSDNKVRKLLSLDGGGVRGMSTIAILRELMERLAMSRKVPVVHPWEEFDMIGGTSTRCALVAHVTSSHVIGSYNYLRASDLHVLDQGGLLAIMLGRLRMSIDECEEVYVKLTQKIFVPKRSGTNIIGRGIDFVNAQGKFSSEVLEAGIKDIVKSKGFSEDELFFHQVDDECKVFVSVVRGENGENTVIRSYFNEAMPNPMRKYCRIWEAARATSAASTFFDSIEIGPHKQRYVDGALGYNNPIRLLDRESKDMWLDSERIFVSIGTGTAPGASLGGNIIALTKRIQEIVLETQKTHEEFYRDYEKTFVANRQYYRFNVEGLRRIGLDEHELRPEIYTATEAYLETGVPGTMLKQLVQVLKSANPTSSAQNGGSTSRAVTTNPTSHNQNDDTLSMANLTASTNNCDGDASRVPTASLQALKITDSPPRKLSFGEKLAAKKEQEERNKKLFRAIALNKFDSVKELLDLGADPNILGQRLDVQTDVYPIYLAATNKFNDILRLLVEHKAKVDIITPYTSTALYGAIVFKNQEGVEILLEGGADPNKINTNGYSPLAYAVQFSDKDSSILDALLLMDADVNLNSPCGRPLDSALRQSQFRTARVLIDRGADPDLVQDHLQYWLRSVPE